MLQGDGGAACPSRGRWASRAGRTHGERLPAVAVLVAVAIDPLPFTDIRSGLKRGRISCSEGRNGLWLIATNAIMTAWQCAGRPRRPATFSTSGATTQHFAARTAGTQA